MSGSGGEPPSEDLGAKIEALAEWLVRNVGWVPEKDDGVIARLRAFAREIRSDDAKTIDALRLSHPGEGTILCTCSSYPHNPNCGLDQRLVVARAALLASQESEKRLRERVVDCEAEHPPEQAYLDWPAEKARLEESARSLAAALELVLNRGTSGRGTALKVLRAYREAGRGKP